MGRDRGARPGTSSGPGGKARSGQITGDTQLSLLSAKNAGHTGLNRIMQAVFSTSTWYAFAGYVNNRRTLLMNGGKLGSRPAAWPLKDKSPARVLLVRPLCQARTSSQTYDLK